MRILIRIQETNLMRIHGDTDPKHWSGLKEDTYKKKCNELRLETLKERREQKNLMLAHKCVGGSIAGGDNWSGRQTNQTG
jgi:hypothetical protein